MGLPMSLRVPSNAWDRSERTDSADGSPKSGCHSPIKLAVHPFGLCWGGSWFDMSCWEVDLLTGCIVSTYFFSPTLTQSIGEVTLRAKVAWRIRPWAWHMDAHGTMRCKTRKQFRRNWHSFLSFEPRSFCIVFEGQDSPMRHAPCAAPEIHVLTWFGPLLGAPNSQIVASQSSQSSQSSLEVVS